MVTDLISPWVGPVPTSCLREAFGQTGAVQSGRPFHRRTGTFLSLFSSLHVRFQHPAVFHPLFAVFPGPISAGRSLNG